MKKLIMVCGGVGAGKTTYAINITKEIGAVRFSIDSWMQTLFAKDMTSLDYDWMIQRVERCYLQIWEVSQQILNVQGSVVLDLGFTDKKTRELFSNYAKEIGVQAELHYLQVPTHIRKERVKKRNTEKDPQVYSFEVTDFMFDFMEPRFEIPDEHELENGKKIEYDSID